MGKTMGIIFEKKEDGSYDYVGVDLEDSNKEIWSDCVKISFGDSKFKTLRDGYNTNFYTVNNSEEKYLALTLEEILFDKLISSFNDSGLSKEEILNEIKSYLEKIGEGIINITASSHGSDTKISLNFPVKEDDDRKNNEKKNYDFDEDNLGFNVDEIDVPEIVADIKTKMVAQDEVINSVVANVYNNQILFDSGKDYADSKACILIDGPTGTGKTFLVNLIADHMKIPMIKRNASSFSAAGYQGDNLSDTLVDLLKAAKGDLKTAERGIIVIDEFDKLCDKDGKGLEMKMAVQQELLTYLSGSKVPIEYDGKRIEFDTSKVTFICLGAFTALRERKESELSDKDDKYRILPEDYIKEGLMREIVGRFSLITCTNSFTREQLKEALLNSKSSPLLKIVEIAKMKYDTDIVYDDEIVDIIVDRAYKMNTGARALSAVVSSINTVLLDDLITRRFNVREITIDDLKRADDTTYRERGPQL